MTSDIVFDSVKNELSHDDLPLLLRFSTDEHDELIHGSSSLLVELGSSLIVSPIFEHERLHLHGDFSSRPSGSSFFCFTRRF